MEAGMAGSAKATAATAVQGLPSNPANNPRLSPKSSRHLKTIQNVSKCCTKLSRIITKPSAASSHVPYYIHYFLQISLLLTTCSNSWALRLSIPETLNHPHSSLLNVSLDSPRQYRISAELNAPFVHRFFDVTPLDGILSLKQMLKCSSDSPANVVPLPVNLFVESRTYSIEGSSNHLTLLHLEIQFEHESCNLTHHNHGHSRRLDHHAHSMPHYQSIASRSSSAKSTLDIDQLNLISDVNPESLFWQSSIGDDRESLIKAYPLTSRVLLSTNDDKLCLHECQFMARLPSFVPVAVRRHCQTFYHIVELSTADNRNPFPETISHHFKIEHSTDDLISLSNFCLQSGSSFEVRLGVVYACDSSRSVQRNHAHHHHHRNHHQQPQATLLSSVNFELLTLTFYARDVDLEEYISRILQSRHYLHYSNPHHHHHQHPSSSHYYHGYSNQTSTLSSSSSSTSWSTRQRRDSPSGSSNTANSPTFDRSLYIVSVPEEREKSFVVTQIVANPGLRHNPSDYSVSSSDHSSGSSELLYSISALIDARSQSMFAIDPVSGLVTTTTRLDREFMDVHYLRIMVTDNNVPRRTAITTLQINVVDENDHVPVFEQANYESSLRESAPIGTTVLTVRATDHDSGPNADIEYSILNPTGVNEAFRIDPKQGVITTRTSLDREKVDLYSLQIQASDSGPVQSRKRSQSTVGIKILDENDNYSQFAERSYSVQVEEDINYASRPVMARIIAHDADEGLNAAVRYSIIGGNTAAVFHIDSLNGEVSVIGPLDYENARSYRLVIRAQDGGSPPRSNTTQLLVNVVDKNDNEPRFYTSLFQENVLENVPIGTSVLRVQAYDADDGENSQLSYHIQTHSSDRANSASTENGDTNSMPISIDPGSGWIVTTRDLDREEAALYEFTVIARDAGQPMQHTATATVIVRVQDLNDNAPVFEPRIYDAVIPETAVPGTPVVSVSATDRDENSRIVFQISGGNIRNRFAIVSQNNQGHITVANLLDYKLEKNYILTVTATDPGGKMDLSTVYINVTDANTHRPVIQLKNGAPFSGTTTSLAEDAPVGTTVLVVEATDDDVGENARITYSLNDIAEFRIDPNMGAIVTTKALDRETIAGYTLVVTAQDNGIPPLSDIANIEIEIVDVNDNVPKFEQEFYTSSVMEDAPVGTSVVQVRAHDRDLGLNGQVRYEFDTASQSSQLLLQPQLQQQLLQNTDSSSGVGVFVIDATSGVIRTNRTLDRETTARYELKIVAIDRGTPAMSSTISAHVNIEDCNDNPPRFASDRLRFYVPENSPIGSVVGELRATDADQGANARIEYTIVGGSDMQWLALKSTSSGSAASAAALASSISSTSSSGTSSALSISDLPLDSDSIAVLVTRTEMDFESEKKVYNIIVRASSLPLRNDVDVEIHVTDVNDHAPLLRDFSIIFNNYRGHFPLGQVIGRVPAYDADVADILRYRFVSGNKANLLFLNETTGELRLSPSLNTNVPTKALLEVAVSDGINEALARCFLSVNLVTESMLFNSVTIRLNRVTRRHFLSSLYDRFLEGLASVIPCSKENIIIFNIQDDSDSSDTLVLNISFSARLSDSLRDTESYYSPQFLQERVYLSRSLLTSLTDLEVLPFDDNLCVREPCLNFEECLSVLKFGNASDFYSTEAILFRAISPVNTFACRCPAGFQGMHHKYECDIEINLCFSSPCQNGGRCVHQEGGYVCLCPDGYAGHNCEINFSNDFCRTGLCRGESRCLNGAARSMKVKPSMVRAGLGLDKAMAEDVGSGFRCVDCPYEQWSSPLCQLRARSFVPGSYLTFSALRQRYRLGLKLKFATREPNGLLLYNGRYNEKHDFIGLELINGKIFFSFTLGANNRAQVSVGERLNDGQWHEIEVNYVNRTATLKLDNCDEALLSAVDRYDLGPEFACANKTTLVLESRCSDRMQTCFRFLDLTGPLQIGGLPPLPTEFQVSNKDFHGCISDLHVDYTLVDFDSYVANNGTTIGCDSKRSFCSASNSNNPCNNRGQCEEAWRGHVCRCEDGYTGQHCQEAAQEAVRHFRGDGFLSFSPNLQPLAYPWLVSFDMKTLARDAIVLSIQLGQSNMVRFEIVGGKLSYGFDDRQPIMMDEIEINDGKWHQIEVKWMATGVTLTVDYGQYQRVGLFNEAEILGLYIAKVTVGGHDTPDEITDAYLYRSQAPAYVGCIRVLDVGNSKDSWLRPTLENNVYEGCQRSNSDQCLSSPCPPNSDCVPQGMNSYECVCNHGFVGKHCIPVCELNPCAYGSTCVPANNTHGYRCLCDRLHSGFYCEDRLPETCPADWWGYPICGPCNCDVGKGYDGNCNKTTGECSCQNNRFQPPGSDVCFECDCYSIGSYNSRCDRLTGQCQCRPGVVGRCCDTCASPFAEVTSRGCEVIYDACPRAFSDGVWWERTPFGSVSTHQCPVGSTGTAERLCREGEGWLNPNLFACLSDTFLDLSEQWKILSESEKAAEENGSLLMNTQHSIKLAHDLRVAINQTEPLYGHDLQLAFRLIRRIIQNELHQSGLNLTHKQDRHFLRNLCESTSAILEPRYASVWEKIAEDDSGPEQFLKLYNQYAEVLIDNQRDTFTEPFEISTKWLVFGLDTVATNELWDISKELLHHRMNSPKTPAGLVSVPASLVPVLITDQQNSRHSRSIRDQNLNTNSTPSIYLDFSLPNDPLASGVGNPSNQQEQTIKNPSVVIPKYNNYPLRKSNIDDITKAIIPLKLLNVNSIDELRSSMMTTFMNPVTLNHQTTSISKSQQNGLVGYTIFTSLAHFLPSNTDSTVRQRFSNPLKANTPIVSLTMKAANGSKFLTKSLHPKLQFRFRALTREGRSSPQCVYWAFPSSSTTATAGITNRKAVSRGRWSSKGCELKGYYPPQRFRSSYDYINCSCDRAFGVAVLMDISGDEFYYEESVAQVALSYSLIMISLSLLALTYLILTLIRGLETNSNSIHKNLVLCIFLTELIFLFGIRMRTSLVQYESICKLVAIFLHYTFQCLFNWMLIESIHLYRMLTEIRDVNHGPMRFYYFLGYAAPAIVVALSVGVRADQYGNHLFCWLSIYEGVIWALVAPICVVIVLNLFVFLLALQASVQIKATVCDYGNLRTLLWLSIVLLPLLAAFWILALLAVNDAIDELHYAFSVTCLLCALYVFIGHCLVNRRVRYNIQLIWRRVTGNGPHGSDESLGATRTSNTSRIQGTNFQSPQHHRGSSFDVYGMRGGASMMPLDSNIVGEPISSSTTSRSSITNKGMDGEQMMGGECEEEGGAYLETDEDGHYHSHKHHHHRRHHHGKCHRKHRRHRHHGHHGHRLSKQNIASETGSSDDVSNDKSMELASSHSSDDEEDDGPTTGTVAINSALMQTDGADHHQHHHHHFHQQQQQELLKQQQENQINSIIQEQQKQHQHDLYGQSTMNRAGSTSALLTQQPVPMAQTQLQTQLPPTTTTTGTSSDGLSSSGANTVIYGQRASVLAQHGGTPAILKQGDPQQAHLVTTSLPFSRSNILAMTAGLGDVAQQSSQQASPASSVHSQQQQIYSGHQVPQTQPKPAQQVEHIYSYARKPTITANPHPQATASVLPSHYSTIGSISKPVIIDDGSIGLPNIGPTAGHYRPTSSMYGTNAATYQQQQPSPIYQSLQHRHLHHTQQQQQQSPQQPQPSQQQQQQVTENPYASRAHLLASSTPSSGPISTSSHVRLINNESDLSVTPSPPPPAPPQTAPPGSQSQQPRMSRPNDSDRGNFSISDSRKLLSNIASDSSGSGGGSTDTGSNHEGDAV